MPLQHDTIVDISLELDPKSYSMRTPAGFKKDMQFEMEVLKEHDAPGGAGQIVRGVHMRLHAGSHVDAPEHNVRGGAQIRQLPLELFIGDAVIADLRDKMPGKAITERDLADMLGRRIQASFVPMAFVLPLLLDGRLKALAVASKDPIANPINIPTALSQGFDYEYGTWYGMLAPGKTPRPVLAVLNEAMVEAGKDPELRSKMTVQGIYPRDTALEQFDAHIRNDMARLAPPLKEIADKR